jgi:hypothetical protein
MRRPPRSRLRESILIHPGSSNGKTRAFGAWYGGSTPPPGTRRERAVGLRGEAAVRYEPVEREPPRRAVVVDRLDAVRFDEDEDRLRAAVVAPAFLADVLRDGDRFAADRAEDLVAGDLLAPFFFADVFLLPEDFVAGDFLLVADFDEDFLFAFCLRSRASAVPPTAAPRAAAPVAASTGFSTTAPATFFAPDPTDETASPAFSTTVEIAERPFSSIRSIRVVPAITLSFITRSRRSVRRLLRAAPGCRWRRHPRSDPPAIGRTSLWCRSRRGPSGSAARS